MNQAKSLHELEKDRVFVARKVQTLRRERHWTQAELAHRLNLSQSRFSEIERGGGSFTAEQFLSILKLFNVAVSDFAEAPDRNSELQNALARLGASHLQESTDTLPSERLSEVGDVLRESIVASEFPRLITALAPVLVRNVDQVNLNKLYAQLAESALERRLGWLIENTVEAIRLDLSAVTSTTWRRLYGRAQVVLGSFLEFIDFEAKDDVIPDVLDKGIRSKRTFSEVTSSSSTISRRWGIITDLQVDDFVAALKGARAAR